MSSTHVPIEDIVRRPGATKAWDRPVVASDLDLDGLLDEQTRLVGDVVLDLDLDAVLEGILVRGQVEFDLDVACSRCLAEIRLEPTVDIVELFVTPGALDDTEGNGIVDVGAVNRRRSSSGSRGGDDRRHPIAVENEETVYDLDANADVLDLGPLLRDLVATEIPVRLLCTDDCAGLCAVCGQDLNEADCGHGQEPTTDPRWAKLAQLDLN